ncbi:hypothetical protein PMAYCL1PPCAC_19024, partial [Pristionchus mayeri]
TLVYIFSCRRLTIRTLELPEDDEMRRRREQAESAPRGELSNMKSIYLETCLPLQLSKYSCGWMCIFVIWSCFHISSQRWTSDEMEDATRRRKDTCRHMSEHGEQPRKQPPVNKQGTFFSHLI